MSNLICRENFNWEKYVERYKDLKSINNIDSAWNHWCEEGKKQGRKFYTLAPFKNNKYYIITKEYIKQKKIKFKSKSNIVISGLDDDIVIEDYVSNIKHKLKKLNKNKVFICQTVNQTNDTLSVLKINDKSNNKKNVNNENVNNVNVNNVNKQANKQVNNVNKQVNKMNNENVNNVNKQVNNDIEILEKEVKYMDYPINRQSKEEWTQRTENSDIFFLEFENNNFDSDESKKYFSKKNPINVFSNSS